jgi:cell wall assembly regulator SMI1
MKQPLEWRWGGEPISQAVVKEIGHQLGVSFPSDYVECACKWHGGHPNLLCIDFPGRKEAVVSHLLSLAEENEGGGGDMSLLQMYETLSDQLPDRVIPFAADPFGNMYCFDFRSGNEPQCVFWNHERSDDSSISLVCGSFSEFLDRLYIPE